MKMFANVKCKALVLAVCTVTIFGIVGCNTPTATANDHMSGVSVSKSDNSSMDTKESSRDNTVVASTGDEKVVSTKKSEAKSEAKTVEKSKPKTKEESGSKATSTASKSTKSDDADTTKKADAKPRSAAKSASAAEKETAKTSKTKQKTTSAASGGAWSVDSNCETCHSDVHASLEGEAGVAQAHSAVSCDTCHSNVDELATIHQETTKTTPGKIRRLKTPVAKETCLQCHGSLEDLAEKTAQCTVLTDSEGTTVNPHVIPDNGEHTTDPACTTCHGMHKDVDPQDYCRSCHHTDIYTCYTCHD